MALVIQTRASIDSYTIRAIFFFLHARARAESHRSLLLILVVVLGLCLPKAMKEAGELNEALLAK